MRRFSVLLVSAIALGIFAPSAQAGCKTYTLTPAKKFVKVTASIISNKGPGSISISGFPNGKNSIFMGNPHASYKVVLISGSKATFQACN